MSKRSVSFKRNRVINIDYHVRARTSNLPAPICYCHQISLRIEIALGATVGLGLLTFSVEAEALRRLVGAD